MNKSGVLAVCLALAGVLSLSACGAEDAQNAGKMEAESRGFSALSVERDGGVISPVMVNVSFGETGCTGTFEYTATARVLRAQVPGKGEVKVDDARVDALRKNATFAPCFDASSAR